MTSTTGFDGLLASDIAAEATSLQQPYTASTDVKTEDGNFWGHELAWSEVGRARLSFYSSQWLLTRPEQLSLSRTTSAQATIIQLTPAGLSGSCTTCHRAHSFPSGSRCPSSQDHRKVATMSSFAAARWELSLKRAYPICQCHLVLMFCLHSAQGSRLTVGVSGGYFAKQKTQLDAINFFNDQLRAGEVAVVGPARPRPCVLSSRSDNPSSYV